MVHSPEACKQIKSESRAARVQLDRLGSRDEASSRGVGKYEQHDQQKASREPPLESRASSMATPELNCTDPSTFSWEVSQIAAVLNCVMVPHLSPVSCSSTPWDLEAGPERVSSAGCMQSEQVRQPSCNIRSREHYSYCANKAPTEHGGPMATLKGQHCPASNSWLGKEA